MIRNRKLVTFTISKEIAGKFNLMAENKSVNKSRLIEKLIIEWLEKNREKRAKTYYRNINKNVSK